MKRNFSSYFNRQSFGAFCGAFLLAAVASGCTTRTFAGIEKPRAAAENRSVSGRVVKEIVGKWRKIEGGGARSVDYARFSGDATGSFETLEIFADGRIRRETSNSFKVYDCPVEDATAADGAIIVESDAGLNLTFDAGTFQHRESCAPANDYATATKPATADYAWKINESNDEMCLAKGAETACYLRIE